MIKIGYVSPTDPKSQAAWSGTVHTIYNALKRRYEVKPIVISNHTRVEKILVLVSKIKSRLFHTAPYQDNVSKITAKVRSWKLNKAVKNLGEDHIDLLFVPAGSTYISYSSFDIPVVYLSDATFHVMIGYYYTAFTKKQKEAGNYIEKRALQCADKVIYSSDWAMNDAINFYKINKCKCSMIPFGANLDAPDQIRPKSIEAKQLINLLFVGVDTERKGLKTAVDTVNELNRNNVTHKFTLTVIGSNANWLQGKENIQVLGFLDKNIKKDGKKINAAYVAADLFILPTTAEAAGIVFAEACMHGLPVLTYSTGGVPTYVRNGVNGFTLPLESEGFAAKVEQLINNPSEYKTLSVNARQLYERTFNWNVWLEDTAKVIDNLVQEF
ncbi:glycosyltransferase family 4 protein [Loigolactobacillus backii]|uniref:glycosyltransferase family 4 protein n=1 Tax=Loigolactobacillus backii TaxID=375175 RepID=UPI0022FD38D7|nr:glycosyltransferase family 4 protein [Loigolactobacillus backii]MDA5388290.1 glycosyltransferase family 4 protein [Loigolactobacillus backii]MDA5390784.1 glycosyltransferase family 4 protein [Loigolactobacillus backii]